MSKVFTAANIDDIRGILLNAVAISESLYQDERFPDFDKNARWKGGSTYVYDLCIEMAKCLSIFEQDNPDIWEELSWEEVVERFTNEMIEYGLNDTDRWAEPNIQEMLEKALELS